MKKLLSFVLTLTLLLSMSSIALFTAKAYDTYHIVTFGPKYGYVGDIKVGSTYVYVYQSGEYDYMIGSVNYYSRCAVICNYRGKGGSVTIPSSIDNLPVRGLYQTFTYDNTITEITIPNSVTIIGEMVFRECHSLTSVTIPNSVTSIGDEAFSTCSRLTSINIPNSIQSIGKEAFYKCYDLPSIEIPDSVTSIGEGAFDWCQNLTSLKIGKGLSEIAHYTFGGCDSLTSVTIPGSVTNIGYGAFQSCDSLTSVTISNGVEEIGGAAFNSCNSLKSVTIPDSVRRIESGAFFDCTSLKSIYIPRSVTEIGDRAFGYAWRDERIDDFTIYGTVFTEAENYADENGFRFVDGMITDMLTGVSVRDIGDDMDFSVTDVTEQYNGAFAARGLMAENIYDIQLLMDGEAVQPEGAATVKIPSYDKNAKVYRMENDNTFTDMNAVFKNWYLTFNTDHFSVYVLAVPYEFGNANLDEVIDVRDVTAIQRHISDFELLSGKQYFSADVNYSSDVTIEDATLLQMYLAEYDVTLG